MDLFLQSSTCVINLIITRPNVIIIVLAIIAAIYNRDQQKRD